MPEIVVLAPSRGRPKQAIAMWRSLSKTAELPTTRLVLVIDRDDPTFGQYPPDSGFTRRYGWDPDAPFVLGLDPEESGNLTRATNSAAARFWDDDVILGHVGDDHRFITPGWDRRVTEALVRPGIAYGDDLLQGAMLPTAVFMSSAIPRALGWMALPTATHLYIDDAWRELGKALGVLRYLPEVIIEHVHPGAQKAKWDEGYDRAFAHLEADKLAYVTWLRQYLPYDVANVRRVIGRRAA